MASKGGFSIRMQHIEHVDVMWHCSPYRTPPSPRWALLPSPFPSGCDCLPSTRPTWCPTCCPGSWSWSRSGWTGGTGCTTRLPSSPSRSLPPRSSCRGWRTTCCRGRLGSRRYWKSRANSTYMLKRLATQRIKHFAQSCSIINIFTFILCFNLRHIIAFRSWTRRSTHVSACPLFPRNLPKSRV